MNRHASYRGVGARVHPARCEKLDFGAGVAWWTRMPRIAVAVTWLHLPGARAQEVAPPWNVEPAEASARASLGLLLDVTWTGSRLVAVGERGNIVVSDDGQHWAQAQVPARSTLTSVFFVDHRSGWAVGHDGIVLHTRDGGSTWIVQRFDPTANQPLLDVVFLDPRRGFAVGAFGLFLSTVDGGQTWTDVDAPVVRELGLHLQAIAAISNGGLLVTGENGLIATSIDGTTWQRQPTAYEGSFFGAVSRGITGAIVFGLRGTAFATQDIHSNAWSRIDLGTTCSLFGGVSLADGSTVVVGSDGCVQTLDAHGTGESHPMTAIAGDRGVGSFSSAAIWPGGFLVVGERGIQSFNAGASGAWR